MNYVVSRGTNIDEAVKLGLKIMDVQKHQVNIEILESGKKGLFNLFSEQAVVKLTMSYDEKIQGSPLENLIDEVMDEKKKGDLSEEKFEYSGESVVDVDELQGKVWVKNGEIFCGASKDNFPTIKIPKDITVLINGENFKGQSLVVLEKDTYELKSTVKEKEMTWKVTMDSDKAKVFLHVEPGYKIDYTILDAEPNFDINLLTKENKQIQNTLNFEDVIKKMGLMGVIHGFNHGEIMKAIEVIEPGIFVIAEGKPAIQGENGWFEPKVSTKVKLGLKEKEDGRVDFKEIKSIPHVDKGKLVGIIHPPVVGKIGYRVTNEPISPKQTYPLNVQSGKGIVIIDDKVITKESGRPQIEQRGLLVKVSMIQKYTHIGNVDISSGNITFKGDVEVLGEVTDQMSVFAAGGIEIHKTVNNAVVNSLGGVILHSSNVRSKITAGNLEFFEEGLATQLESIITTVDEITKVLEAVTNSETFQESEYTQKSIQPLLRILIDRKFTEFPSMIKNFMALITKAVGSLEDKKWRRIGENLSILFLSLSAETKFHENLQQLTVDMKSLVEDSSEPTYEQAFITTPNATNSRLYSSGDISVTDKGCINTEIRSGGYVQINGILRGGEVYGRLGVTVGEAGAISSTSTIIVVPRDQSIKIDKVLEGVILKVGRDVYKFTETAFNVHAYINEKESLIVDYTSE